MRKWYLAAPVLIGLCAHSLPAWAQDAWTGVEGQAIAVLPAPSEGPAVAGRLTCAEQKWSLDLELKAGYPTISGPITLAIDSESFSASAVPQGALVAIAVPHRAIDKIKTGIRLRVKLSLEGEDSQFSLRGSRRAIEAAEAFCSPRDMSAYTQILVSPEDPDISLARTLREAEIRAFRLATASEPSVAAGSLDVDGKRIIFAELCGSSWYFGRSGCNLAGFIPAGSEGEWRLVFDAEGASLYVDPRNDVSGWPDLIAVPLKSSGPETAWRWDGERYRFAGERVFD